MRNLFVGAMMVLFAQSAFAQTIIGTDHDLSGRGWGSDQACVFCHTPHNAKTGVSGAPLWNHEVTTATFTTYSSDTFTATDLVSPDGSSKLCLSCHDGTVAVDSYGVRTGANTIAGSALVGTNLSNDHPISFTYNASLATADGGLASPFSTAWVDSGKTLPLYNGKMQCASCHNVHSNQYGDFLRMANAGSALCLKCHKK
jgi:predicted CXXCH cytochrome family protein